MAVAWAEDVVETIGRLLNKLAMALNKAKQLNFEDNRNSHEILHCQNPWHRSLLCVTLCRGS